MSGNLAEKGNKFYIFQKRKPEMAHNWFIEKIASEHCYVKENDYAIFRGERNLAFLEAIQSGKYELLKSAEIEYKRKDARVPVFATPSFVVALCYAFYNWSENTREIEQIRGFKNKPIVFCFIKPRILRKGLRNVFFYPDNEVIIDLAKSPEYYYVMDDEIYEYDRIVDDFFQKLGEIFGKSTYTIQDYLRTITKVYRNPIYYFLRRYEEYVDYLVLTKNLAGLQKVLKIAETERFLKQKVDAEIFKKYETVIDYIIDSDDGKVVILVNPSAIKLNPNYSRAVELFKSMLDKNGINYKTKNLW